MRKHKWPGRIVILAVLFIVGMKILAPGDGPENRTGGGTAVRKAEDMPDGMAGEVPDDGADNIAGILAVSARNEDEDKKGEETIVGWMIDRIAAGEVELSEESSIRQALDEAESELGISLEEDNKDSVVAFLQTLGNIGVETGDFIDQAREKYQEYSAGFVEEANEAINDAVEHAVTNAAQNFFDSIRQAAGDFFRDLIPE